MNTVQIVIFALCIYQISATTYEEALAHCRKESKIADDKPVDHFFAHAAWPADITTAHCYFNCFGKQLNIVDTAGVPNKSKLAEIAKQRPDVTELQVLASDDSFTACTSHATGATECAATENFVTCAIKNAAAKKTKSLEPF